MFLKAATGLVDDNDNTITNLDWSQGMFEWRRRKNRKKTDNFSFLKLKKIIILYDDEMKQT